MEQRSRISDFEILQKIGKGSYGQVFRVKRKIDQNFYCLKQIDIQQLNLKEQQDTIQEVTLLAKLNSPYIIRYYDSFIDNGMLNIIMELADQGNLAEYIQKQKITKKPIPEDIVWKFLIEISIGLYHIHSNKVIHRDVKTLNIFLAKNNTVKIGDLGVAKLLDTHSFAQTTVGTPYYLSPELIHQIFGHQDVQYMNFVLIPNPLKHLIKELLQ
ncbi:MAG: putative MAP kinase kinase family domain protein [Streblomastix strix]|uniref:non-specific serine/threonine protein kinase n=1 Tax=Streblomastix strix TaxID=222440 RepID=A0A5J4X7H9_9EUKA|nr:MAG: putative MAP kinase kinase family domain protein [Streblomastix strix]